MKREKLDPDWHKARVAARIWLKLQAGKTLSPRDKRLGRIFAEERGVSDRLIQQGVMSLLGGPRRIYQTPTGPKPLLEILGTDELRHVLERALGKGNRCAP